MEKDNPDYDKTVEFMVESAERQGAACISTSDGHVIMFRRDHLEELLKKNPDAKLLTVFVQRRNFKN